MSTGQMNGQTDRRSDGDSDLMASDRRSRVADHWTRRAVSISCEPSPSCCWCCRCSLDNTTQHRLYYFYPHYQYEPCLISYEAKLTVNGNVWSLCLVADFTTNTTSLSSESTVGAETPHLLWFRAIGTWNKISLRTYLRFFLARLYVASTKLLTLHPARHVEQLIVWKYVRSCCHVCDF